MSEKHQDHVPYAEDLPGAREDDCPPTEILSLPDTAQSVRTPHGASTTIFPEDRQDDGRLPDSLFHSAGGHSADTGSNATTGTGDDPNALPESLHDGFSDRREGTSPSMASVPKFTSVGGILLTGVVALIGIAILVSTVWLLFTPSPTSTTEEAAEIISEDLENTLSEARAFQIENPGYNDETGTIADTGNVSTLTVETESGMCRVYRATGDGSYRSVSSEGRLISSYLRFEPVNYMDAHAENNSMPVFQYYHSADERQHGVNVNMRAGPEESIDEHTVDLSGQYTSNQNVSDESFCF